jgi:RNA polymerase sigma-70 factor (ECF subfamily)
MEDEKIIGLFFARSENAISETAQKYGGYCHSIAWRILQNQEDSEECVSDTYLKAWESIPPKRPEKLRTYLGKLTRNLALHIYEKYHAEKRGMGRTALALDELKECIPAFTPAFDPVAGIADDMALKEILNQFLSVLPVQTRLIFLRRYWYFDTIAEIAAAFRVSESKVKMSLLRSRGRLKQLLEKEGICL